MADDYLSCKSYTGHKTDSIYTDFKLFEKSKKFYFAYLDLNQEVFLRSEAYPDENSRTIGIKAVQKNANILKRYSIINQENKFYIVLKAGNHKEIGRSCFFKTKAAAQKKLESQNLVEKAKSTTAVSQSTPVILLKSLENYLESSEYLDKPRIYDSYGITGFVKFIGPDGKHYFGVYNPDATLYLRSTGFETEEKRDEAFDLMESIILLEENYKIENFEGEYYAVLFEENEIVSISRAFNSFIEAFVTTPGGRPKETVGTMY